MRIILCSDTFPPQINGVANHTHTLADELTRRGHIVLVATALGERPFGGFLRRREKFDIVSLPSLPAFVAPGLRAALPSLSISATLRDFQPDLIHVHTPMMAGWAGVRAAQKLHIPLIGTHHTFFDIYLREAGLSIFERASWRYTVRFYGHCDAVIAPSDAMREAFVAQGLRVPVEKIENGIDLTRFTPAKSLQEKENLKKELQLKGPVILYLGRLSREKRVDEVIEGFAILKKSVQTANMLILGDGPDRKRLEALAFSTGIGESILFRGFIVGDELVSRIRAADVFVSASEFENMPLSVLEAMACGLPVVAVRSLGMAEIIRDGVEGFLCVGSNRVEIAQRLQDALSEGQLSRMSLAAHVRSEQFGQEKMAERIEHVYQAVLAKRAVL